MSELLYVKGGPTKPEIIAISLSKLDLKDGDTFYDIGCGTGAVSIEASKIAKDLKITAIDARKEAIDVARQNFKNFGINNVNLIYEESSRAVQNAEPDTIDCAFIGGTKNITAILETLCKKKAKHIVVNAVRIETVVITMNKMKELGIFQEIVHITISRGYEITGETMFKPENPVYTIIGGYK